MNEMEFRQRAAELGYGEPQVKDYPPNATSELYAHDFSAFAMVAVMANSSWRSRTAMPPIVQGTPARFRPARATPKSRVQPARRCGSQKNERSLPGLRGFEAGTPVRRPLSACMPFRSTQQ